MPARRRTPRPALNPRLTLRGVIFLASGGALFVNALLTDRRDLLFIAFLLLAVPLVALVSVTVRPPRLGVTRTFRPPVVPVGSETAVRLQVRNLSIWPLSDASWSDTASAAASVPRATPLPPLESSDGGRGRGTDSAVLEYTFTPHRRGVHPIGPFVLGRQDPFGLAVSERRVGEAHDLIVTPRVTALPGSGTSVSSGDGSVHEQLRRENPNSDELIAREYRPGDPLRRVNWPATARHGEIMVRQEEQRSSPEVFLVLDTTMSGRLEGSARGSESDGRHDACFELAIELAASIGLHLLDAGFRLNVAELGPSQLSPGKGHEGGGLHGDPPTTFRPPGGDRLLLEGLAGMDPVRRSEHAETRQAGHAALRAADAHAPVFAVIVDVGDQDVADLVAVRAHSGPAVAFTAATVRPEALDGLREGGWKCVSIRASDEIEDAWYEAQRESGAVHGRA